MGAMPVFAGANHVSTVIVDDYTVGPAVIERIRIQGAFQLLANTGHSEAPPAATVVGSTSGAVTAPVVVSFETPTALTPK